MKLQLYSVRDIKMGIYNAPWFLRSHGEAERNFQRLSSDKENLVGQFPADYALYHLGEYDDETGLFDTMDVPKLIVSATAMIEAVSRSGQSASLTSLNS